MIGPCRDLGRDGASLSLMSHTTWDRHSPMTSCSRGAPFPGTLAWMAGVLQECQTLWLARSEAPRKAAGRTISSGVIGS